MGKPGQKQPKPSPVVTRRLRELSQRKPYNGGHMPPQKASASSHRQGPSRAHRG